LRPGNKPPRSRHGHQPARSDWVVKTGTPVTSAAHLTNPTSPTWGKDLVDADLKVSAP
jgi:hypothetical protein